MWKPTEIVGTPITNQLVSLITPDKTIIAKIAENYRFQQAIEFADMDYAMGVAAK